MKAHGSHPGADSTLYVDEDPALASPLEFTATADDDGWLTFQPTGLAPDTTYHFACGGENGRRQDEFKGKFRTTVAPGTPHSFTFGASSCAGMANTVHMWPHSTAIRVSNAPVFDNARLADPLFFAWVDDFHYRDIGNVAGADRLYRETYDRILQAPRRAQFHRNVPLAYMFGNHDAQEAGHANSTDAWVAAAVDPVYRQCVPSYPVQPGKLWQSWQIGRVLFILTDNRSHRTPGPPPSLLGAEQKQWLKDQLTNTTAELVVWFSGDPWTVGAGQGWGAFPDERTELGTFIANNGWSDKLILVSGHLHYSAFHDGTTNPNGGFREFMVSGMDSVGGSDGGGNHGPWTAQSWEVAAHAPPTGGFYLWGRFDIADDGANIVVTFDGFDVGTVWGSSTFAVPT